MIAWRLMLALLLNVDQYFRIRVLKVCMAFASQFLYCQKKLEIDPQKINVNGGAMAIGYPLGATELFPMHIGPPALFLPPQGDVLKSLDGDSVLQILRFLLFLHFPPFGRHSRHYGRPLFIAKGFEELFERLYIFFWLCFLMGIQSKIKCNK
ncbi:hypothetical protein L6452_09462 [Arctium lappa]|uniref:Uncharacterized protein n=1 Tax=Arctium lappa TaxID=4217 RepID=A0ACB9DKK1_ARCLA|nr:hypothetical protein L6452_09462 [Arctium lappa]